MLSRDLEILAVDSAAEFREVMMMSRRALRQAEILAVDYAAEFPPDQPLHYIYCSCS